VTEAARRRLVHRAMERVRGWAATARRAATTPGPERDNALLALKSAVATVVAWQFAVQMLDSPRPFYAPLAALMVVHRTVVRSFWVSVQRLAAVIVGMAVAWLVGTVACVHWWSMLPVLLVALLIAKWRRLGEHGVDVPIMVLFSLLTVGGTDVDYTYLAILETAAGGVIALATNAVVLAPLHIREPRQRVAALAQHTRRLLGDISEGLRSGWDAEQARGWHAGSDDVSGRVPEVLEHIREGRESTRLNPRNLHPATSTGPGTSAPSRPCAGRTGTSPGSPARSPTRRMMPSGSRRRRPPSSPGTPLPSTTSRRPRTISASWRPTSAGRCASTWRRRSDSCRPCARRSADVRRTTRTPGRPTVP
jgi:hypothetical protein